MNPWHRPIALLLAVGALLLLTPAAARAQVTTADLVGTIKDSTGGVLPGVTVVLTNEATGVSRSATTGAGGTYIFTSLPPAPTGSPPRCRAFARSSAPEWNCRSISARRSISIWRSAPSARPS